MTESNQLTNFTRYMNEHCVYSDSNLRNHIALYLFDGIFNILAKINVEELAQYVVRFAVPTNDGVPWLLKDRKSLEKVRALAVEMAESKVFRVNREAREKVLLRGASAASPAKQQPKPKRRTRKSAKKAQQHTADDAAE
eukprot:9527483-Alexandrium_andersonii.AAC.1